ncbi:MAG: hypothetical protein ACLGH7_14525 [Actinomycetes bacterium]
MTCQVAGWVKLNVPSGVVKVFPADARGVVVAWSAEVAVGVAVLGAESAGEGVPSTVWAAGGASSGVEHPDNNKATQTPAIPARTFGFFFTDLLPPSFDS